MKKLLLYYHTLKHLKPVQLYGRVWFKLYRPRPDTRSAPARRPVKQAPASFCLKHPSMSGPREFVFLNQRGEIDRASDWDSPELSKLWRYNLHYFDDLNAAEASKRKNWHRELIRSWIKENSPGHGTGWEPYPSSLRIVNWVKWLILGNEAVEGMADSLAVQARWLNKRLEYHLLGNHLLANAKALVFAGLFFEGGEAENLYQKGMKILADQLPEQILADGGHFERSPMYHLIVAEDLLDLINLHDVYGKTRPEGWGDFAQRMLEWSRVMRHPDGGIPFFNDAAFGIAPEPGAVDEYGERLGIRAGAGPGSGVRLLEESGYARMEKDDAVVLADVGPVGPDYLPGHAHADTLSFELSIRGCRVIVNSGTSQYEGGPERLRQRSTEAHSTVMVGGMNSSEVWGGFRVARRARICAVDTRNINGIYELSAVHDGYLHLPGRPLHRRTWKLDLGSLVVEDEILTQSYHTIESILYFHPDIRVESVDPYKSSLYNVKQEETLASIEWWPEGELRIENTFWFPKFNQIAPSIRCIFKLKNLSKPIETGFRLKWGNAKKNEG